MRPARVLRRRSFWLDLFACFLIPAYTLLFAGSVEWFGTNFSVIAVTGKDHYWGFVYWGMMAGGYFAVMLTKLALILPRLWQRIVVCLLTLLACLALGYALAIPYLPDDFPGFASLHVVLAAGACVLLMLAVTWSARRFGYKPEHDHPAPLSEILKALLDSIWAILFPVLLIVLIRFGIMSPTESGSFACAYALLVGTVFYHELTWESLLQTLRDSVKDITVITIILAFSGVFGYGIVFDNITVTIANTLLGITSNSAILLLLVVVFLLICGMFMETTVIALILTPILLPVMRSIGVNEVVFGMIMMTTVTFGVMTPPVGTALYAVSDIMECPIEETFKKGWPFYLAIVGVILFMIFFPQAVLFLPNLVYGA